MKGGKERREGGREGGRKEKIKIMKINSLPPSLFTYRGLFGVPLM